MRLGKLVLFFLVFFLFISTLFPIESIISQELDETKEEWEDQPLEWYYDNLDDEDRRKIRQAMDYAIPRQQIIETFFQGLAIPLATDIGQNIVGYDHSIQPRKCNLTKATELMTEVFGKTYDNSYLGEQSNNVTAVPYFNITLIKRGFSAIPWNLETLIGINFREIGINVELRQWHWNIIMPRIYLEPVGIGYNYDHGGVDAWFIEKLANTDPDLSSQYFISAFAPTGNNAFWLENQEVTNIINRSLNNPIPQNRLESLSDFQKWFYEEVPKSIIYQKIDIFAVDEDLEGFDTYLVGQGWCFNNWTIGTQNSMNYSIPVGFEDFNLLLSSNYSDFIPMRNVFGSLSQRRGAYNITHLVPQVAESWNSNSDGTIWEVKIRDGINWSDGTNLTTEDVLFTYHAVFEDDLASPNQRFFLNRFPNNSSDIHLKDGTTDTIVFELGAFYPYVTSQVFGLPILQKTQWESIPYSDWKTHTLNTGTGTDYPVGCGPYMMTDFDISTGVKLEVNPYFDQAIFGHDPDAEGGGIWFTNPILEEIYVVAVKYATVAIAGLTSGTYDVIDSHLGLQAQYGELNTPNNEYNSKCIKALTKNWYELNYNHYDPRWGMNAHDPRELYAHTDSWESNIFQILFEVLNIAGILVFTVLIVFLLRKWKKF